MENADICGSVCFLDFLTSKNPLCSRCPLLFITHIVACNVTICVKCTVYCDLMTYTLQCEGPFVLGDLSDCCLKLLPSGINKIDGMSILNSSDSASKRPIGVISGVITCTR